MSTVSAISIAGKLIQNSFAEDLRLTNMQLQKMVYIVNGFYLASTGNPLIKEKVEAWNYGPVIPALYHEYKKYGSGYINIDLSSAYFESLPTDDAILNRVIDFTWNSCKNLDGITLSNWTHKADSPWTKALQEGLSIIPDKYMADYFKKFIKQPANA